MILTSITLKLVTLLSENKHICASKYCLKFPERGKCSKCTGDKYDEGSTCQDNVLILQVRALEESSRGLLILHL